jgi:xanthine dehydrogenase accessory factor
MNENEYLAKIAREQLKAGLPIVLISIIGLQGSTPRQSGTKMVVGVDGKPYGTIGGSLMEAATITEAKGVISSGKSKILTYELSGEDATAPGMICGGEAEILLDYIPAIEENQTFFQCWYDLVRQGKDFYFITHLKGTGNSLQVLHHAILHSDGSIVGNATFSEIEIESLKPKLHNISTTSILHLKDTWVMIDRIRKLKTLYCFGAGHVAVPTAHLAVLVGFRVVVIDDRPEFANAERFPEAYEILVVKDFNHAFERLELDEDSFIVIFTRGHQYDRACLEQSLKTSAGYIGMISSKRKRAAIYEALMAAGMKKERLGQVHSPIGIDIGGETPEEIAVSIVAEMIKVRSQQAA